MMALRWYRMVDLRPLGPVAHLLLKIVFVVVMLRSVGKTITITAITRIVSIHVTTASQQSNFILQFYDFRLRNLIFNLFHYHQLN